MVESQKLKFEDIKVGDKVIAVEKQGSLWAIAIVQDVGESHIDSKSNGFGRNYFDFYRCPPSLKLIPNCQANGNVVVALEDIRYGHCTSICRESNGRDESDGIQTKADITNPIPDTPEIELTIKINGKESNLSDISEETLLKIRNA